MLEDVSRGTGTGNALEALEENALCSGDVGTGDGHWEGLTYPGCRALLQVEMTSRTMVPRMPGPGMESRIAGWDI